MDLMELFKDNSISRKTRVVASSLQGVSLAFQGDKKGNVYGWTSKGYYIQENAKAGCLYAKDSMELFRKTV